MEKSVLDSRLWHACAGGMVQMPPVNSKVFYFPQGHAEHAFADVDFSALPKMPPLILCRVNAVKYLADLESDEVYAKIQLVPVANNNDPDFEDAVKGTDSSEKPTSFAKTLTQSDANNGGGFSVPRYCAETIFPRLDYAADPPVQTVIARDVHGETWKFRHIYRGTPRRHLLTTGWSTFVNHKKLVAGDSIVFLRADNGDLCVGIRRAKRGGGNLSSDTSSYWNMGSGGFVGFSSLFRKDEDRMKIGGSTNGNPNSPTGGCKQRGRASPQSVSEAAYLAATGQPFEVVYYPCANTPEFCVRASSVNSSMAVRWSIGLRFKMAFETEDTSRISWFMGTISSVQVYDPILWPNSPWRILQVTWDEPDLLQNVKQVSPWLVELISNLPMIHLSPFSQPRKKSCLQPLTIDGQFPIPSFSSNPLGVRSYSRCPSDNIPAGMQGARHAQFGGPLFGGLLPPTVQQIDYNDTVNTRTDGKNENISCSLTMGNNYTEDVPTPRFMLFGQPILTEQQVSTRKKNSGSDMQFDRKSQDTTGRCDVFIGSVYVGRNLDLSIFRSYEELHEKLANMCGIERSKMLSCVTYRDATGILRQMGNEPFREFTKNAKRLEILMNPGSTVGRTWLTGLPTADCGLNSSSREGALGIFV
ncbi:unnamed protein product [Cuscuta epithymum]|uniref:Auxin response factor n=2 Tax=Cuscuta epithymum TaxID=186058 RepID=A0AAV0DAQ7_9ASTE|nr:unnamed protein product [Cuscuta epithymum]CAH9138110.1 unnamed protein product [Cuscuta epithymum]CAH9138247.1 unnamed protein product [Cuscuta epithymum]